MPLYVTLNANNAFWDEDFLVEAGRLTEEAEHVFQNGHCHSLALAIHERTGWPLVGVHVDGWEVPHHVVVRHPTGYTFDVLGFGVEHRWADLHGEEEVELADLDVDYVRSACPDDSGERTYREPEVEIAALFVDAVLELIEED